MGPIKQCYLAYRHEAQTAAALDKALDSAKEMLPCKEYDALHTEVDDYCEEAFVAGFRFAVQLFRNAF